MYLERDLENYKSALIFHGGNSVTRKSTANHAAKQYCKPCNLNKEYMAWDAIAKTDGPDEDYICLAQSNHPGPVGRLF